MNNCLDCGIIDESVKSRSPGMHKLCDECAPDMKYKLIDETIDYDNTLLYRIQALKNFSNVSKGQLGGYIQSESNLSQLGDCWIYQSAKVYEEAEIYGNARIYDNPDIHGQVKISGNARVYGHTNIFGNTNISGMTEIYGNDNLDNLIKLKMGEKIKYYNDHKDGVLYPTKDPINPSYYKLDLPCDSFDYQIAVCKRVPADEAPLVFNVLKYVARYALKNGSEDIKKSIWYAQKLLEILERKNEIRK